MFFWALACLSEIAANRVLVFELSYGDLTWASPQPG